MDSLNEVLIQRAITKLAARRTVLMIAHYLQVERGRHKELLTRGGVYSELWQAQMSAKEWTIV